MPLLLASHLCKIIDTLVEKNPLFLVSANICTPEKQSKEHCGLEIKVFGSFISVKQQNGF